MTTTRTTAAQTWAKRVEASKVELANALADHAVRATALSEAQGAVASQRQGWRAGDHSLTDDDAAQTLLVARTKVDVCTDRLQSADDRVRRARAGLLNDDVSLAAVLAAAIGELPAFAGFQIVTGTEAPAVPKSITRPRLHLIQTAATEHDAISGRSTGLVDAYLHRPTYARPLEADDLGEDLTRMEVYTDVASLGTRVVGDIHEDRARFGVRGVWPDVPIISTPNGVNIFGQTLAGRIAKHLSIGRPGPLRRAREGGLGSTTAHAAAVSGQGAALVKEVKEVGNERRTTVDVALTLHSTTVGTSLLASGVNDHLPTYNGNCEAGLGRVESVQVLPGHREAKSDNRNTQELRLDVRFIFHSRVP